MSILMKATLLVSFVSLVSLGALAGCEVAASPAPEEQTFARALVSSPGATSDEDLDDDLDDDLDAPDACTLDDLEDLAELDYSCIEELIATCGLGHQCPNDISLEDILAELGIFAGCLDDEMWCHGVCVRYEDAEAHGC